MTEHKNNHVTMNFTVTMFGLFCQLWTGNLLFEAARTYQSYRASLILAYLMYGGTLLVCTLLLGHYIYIETGLTPYWHLFGSFRSISQNSGIYSKIPANAPDNFNLLF